MSPLWHKLCLYSYAKKKKLRYRILCPHGGMAEWLKAHDSKSCMPPKGIEGSNPSPSATVELEMNKEPKATQ